MYKIKQLPEDFIVEEVSNIKIQNDGIYTYFSLKKKDYTTNKAIAQIANSLNIEPKRFSFAGLKDKQAITTQICSVKGISKEQLEKIQLKDIELKYLGKGPTPISMGDLEGNNFTITVRNLERIPKKIPRIPNTREATASPLVLFVGE